MYRIFLGLALLGTLLFVAVGVTGAIAKRAPNPELIPLHLMLGVFAAIYLCGLHTLTMFHLIGTGKDMKEQALVLKDHYAEILDYVKGFKKQVFPLATITMLVTIAAEVVGGGVHTRALPSLVHQSLVGAAFVLNLWAFWVEYRAVKQNLILMFIVDSKLAELNRPK